MSALETGWDSLRKTPVRSVILSPSFFAKEWPQRELNALLARETVKRSKVLLPVWHNVTVAEMVERSPILADRVAVSTSKGLSFVMAQILQALEAEQVPKEQLKEIALKAKEVVTPSGLKYINLAVGEGEEAKAGQVGSVHYTGWLTNDTKFDSSLNRGPFSFELGAGQSIRGFDEGVTGMKLGGKRKLTIPPTLAYGSQSVGGVISPNSTLIFEVEVCGIKNRQVD